MQFKLLFPVLSLVLFYTANAANEPKSISSELKSVTVYRSGAEMAHQASTQLFAGNNDLVIENISNNMDINSVQINCPAAVTILSVEFTNDFLVIPEISARIGSLKDSAEKVQKELDRINVQVVTTTDLLEVLKSNRELKGSQTGLSVAELASLMDYYKIKSAELQNDLAEQKEKQKRLMEVAGKIKNQVQEEETKNTKQAGRLHLQLSVAVTGRYNFLVSYITPNAYWTPTYDIRVENIKSPLKVIYKAKVVQTTGIDWKKIKLSLSTSLPSQWGNAPVLKSWFLSYFNPVNVMEKSLASNTIQNINSGSAQLNEVVVSGFAMRGVNSMNNSSTPVYIVGGAIMSAEEFSKINPASIKKIDVIKGAAATAIYGSRAANGATVVTLKDGLEDYVSVADNELNVTFDIDLPYDVPTNGKEQTATLKEYLVNAHFKYYSVPRLDKDAYLLAAVSEWEKLNLLPGDASIIFEGTYVGRSFIDPNSTLDTLNLTLGRDKRVVVKKEKLVDYSSVKFLGSNKLQKITYEITAKNNKQDTVRILLKDQYPLSTMKEIEIELVDAGGAIVNTDIGTLTWKLELAPGESKKIRFTYNVKYPKERLVNLN